MLRAQLVKKKNEIQSLLFPYLHPATDHEKELIEMLRQEIGTLPPHTGAQPDWENNLYALRKDIGTKDPRNFLRWPVIVYTMFHECRIEELAYLEGLPTWTLWQKVIMESKIGNPRPYKAYPQSSGNLIHHAYSLAQIMQTLGIRIDELKNVFEFGGGYGSMARVFYNLGFRGKYTIFDLPEFTALQRYYLKSVNPKWNVALVSSIQDAKKQLDGQPVDMLIGTWSLSESPIAIRKETFDLTSGAKYYLIAYQSSFGDINNVEYFKNFQMEHPDYTWTHFPIAHLPGSFYLFGKKNQ